VKKITDLYYFARLHSVGESYFTAEIAESAESAEEKRKDEARKNLVFVLSIIFAV